MTTGCGVSGDRPRYDQRRPSGWMETFISSFIMLGGTSKAGKMKDPTRMTSLKGEVTMLIL